mgnify:FL=1
MTHLWTITSKIFKMKKLILFATMLFVLFHTKGHTQIPQLFKDITTIGISGVPNYQFSHAHAILGDKIYFAGQTANHKLQLWSTDGTVSNTNLVKEINPNGDAQPSCFFIFNNNLYFGADDGVNGFQLWKSDGTAAGTNLFATTFAGAVSPPFPIAIINNKLIFSAIIDSGGSRQLFSTDGTTFQILNPNFAASNQFGDLDYEYGILNDKMYFSASLTSSILDSELWVTDGTVAGTYMLKDINSGATFGSAPQGFCKLNNKLYFTAVTASYGDELWETDGTSGGTILVKDIRTGTAGSGAARKFVWNNKLYFNASNVAGPAKMFVSDGTAAGTTIFDANLSIMVGKAFLDKGSSMVFAAFNATTGNEWYLTDGTTTTLLTDIYTGTQHGIWDANLSSVINNKIYFTGNTAATGPEPWVTDGTVTGTYMLKDIRSGSVGSLTGTKNKFVLFGSNIYFTASSSNSVGEELWYFNPSVLSTSKVSRDDNFKIYPNPSSGNFNIEIDENLMGAKASIYNLLGQKIKDFKLNSTTTNQNLNKGIYLLEIEKDGTKTSKKLIVN